jgi:hypothetical protein
MDWMKLLGLQPPAPKPQAAPTPNQQMQDPLYGLGSLDDRDNQLQQQLAQAHALRKSNMASQHSTGLGSALGGLGDIFNNVSGAIDEHNIEEGRKAIYDKQDKGRAALDQQNQALVKEQQARDMEMQKLWTAALRQRLGMPGDMSAPPLPGDEDFLPYPGGGQ